MLPSPLSWSLLLSSPALSPFAALFFVAVFLAAVFLVALFIFTGTGILLVYSGLSYCSLDGWLQVFKKHASDVFFRACILSTWLREGWQPVPYSDQTPQWRHYFYKKKKCLQWFCRCWLPFFWFFWSLPWFFLPSPACCWFSNLLGKCICTTVVLLQKKEAWLSVSSHSDATDCQSNASSSERSQEQDASSESDDCVLHEVGSDTSEEDNIPLSHLHTCNSCSDSDVPLSKLGNKSYKSSFNAFVHVADNL